MDQVLLERLKKIKILALDCDGVMAPLHIDTGAIMDIENAMKYTDRKIKFVVEIARFNHRDGQGIDMVKEAGINVVVVTKQRSGYVDARCFKLGIPCLRVTDKLSGLNEWLRENYPDIGLDEICYMGDDVSDIQLIKSVGLGIAVADSIEEAKSVADYVTVHSGGDKAVREVCDMIIQARMANHE